jgi:hypothetical protein
MSAGSTASSRRQTCDTFFGAFTAIVDLPGIGTLWSSLLVDDPECGSWEEHVDGHNVARIDDRKICAPDRAELVRSI